MTVRNNEERLGINVDPPLTSEVLGEEAIPQQEQAQTPQLQQPTSSPLGFPMPTQIVDLPSEGKYYPAESGLFGKESIELRFMTAKDEDILTSKSLIRKGVAIDRLIQNLLVDKTVNVDELLVGDKNALVVSARMSGFGEEYETETSCPSCGERNNHVFDLTKCFSYPGLEDQDLETLNVRKVGDNLFSLTLPILQVEVCIKFLNGYDEKELTREQERKRKLNFPETATTDQLKSIIASVAGEEDRGAIGYFIENMPSQDSLYLRKIYDMIAPNVDMKVPYDCPACGYSTEDMEVPLTPDFFWPKR